MWRCKIGKSFHSQRKKTGHVGKIQLWRGGAWCTLTDPFSCLHVFTRRNGLPANGEVLNRTEKFSSSHPHGLILCHFLSCNGRTTLFYLWWADYCLSCPRNQLPVGKKAEPACGKQDVPGHPFQNRGLPCLPSGTQPDDLTPTHAPVRFLAEHAKQILGTRIVFM